MQYLLMPIMGILLVAAQALWASAIKNQKVLDGSISQIITNVITNPRMWLGAGIYIVATVVYFMLLSQNKFYVVQIGMTAIAIIFSTILASVLFKETIDLTTVAGIGLVLVGLALVIRP